MKRKLGVLAVIATLFLAVLPAHALKASTTVTVHYQRFDNDYTDWNLWLWPKGKDGAGYTFTTKDSFGVSGTFTVPNTASSDAIGIIVRLSKGGNDWAAKDVSEDRYITTFLPDGSAEIWLIQDDKQIYYSEPVTTPEIVSASIDNIRSVTVRVNKLFTPAPGNNDFTITGPGNPKVESVKTISGAKASTSLTITSSADFSLDGNYRISHPTYGEATMTMGNVLNSERFNSLFTYDGNDLGNVYSATQTAFRVWAPTASAAKLVVYPADGSRAIEYDMAKDVKGTWIASLRGDQHGTIYTYKVKIGDYWNEAVDPYVRAATVNGARGVVVDLARTNPAGWPSAKPAFSGEPTDAVFYELHVRDLSMDANSGISAQHRGKFLGLTELGTRTPDGKGSTGIDAIKALGVTHLQLLPIYDYKTIDETTNDKFNWGYDPLNYNVPEGSYSTKPADPLNRIIELKQTIDVLHKQGLRVIMDVVYNHVFDAGTHSFEQLVPGYFFRKNPDGSLGNGTGVGNEVASERPMARKFIVDSIKYWATEYNLDGYRFDLMGIHDVTTMNEVRAALDKIDPTILVIGEGWNMGNLLPSDQKANQLNAYKMPRISHFNDGIRDGVKGSVFEAAQIGYAQGALGRINEVKAGIVGNISHGGGIGGGWGNIQPGQSVTYVEAHDNLTLFDKLEASMPRASAAERQRVFHLASSIALLAQGLPFIHAGQEFMRSKGGDENSYKSSDAVNSLKWSKRNQYKSTVDYFSGLIELRKQHPAFRMRTAAQVKANLRFSSHPSDVIIYTLNGKAVGDAWSRIVVAHNPNKQPMQITLPATANWQVVVNGSKAGTKTLQTLKATKRAMIPAQTTLVMHS